jgi:hypothetical protein
MVYCYEKNKKCIYKWRINNREKHMAANRKSASRIYRWKRGQMEFLNILLPEYIMDYRPYNEI